MGGSPIPVGPFNGGLNLSRDPRLIAENELASCVNFDVGVSGELTVRPGVRALAGPAWTSQEILTVAKVSGTQNEIYLQGISGGVSSVAWNNSVHNPTWNTIITWAAGDKAGDAVQYNNKVWISGVGPTAVGKSVDTSTHAVADVAAMPKGTKSFIYKDRMFLFNTGEYRVYYSGATDLTSWPGANFFDINPGDGEPILSAVVSAESVVFFKQNSAWILYYDSDPGLGTLRKLNTDIGVSGEHAVTIFNNDVYTVGHRGVYRLTNNFFEDISTQLDIFKLRSVSTIDNVGDYVRSLGDRLLVRIAVATGVYRYFVLSLETNIWTEYTFPAIVDAPYRFQDSDSFDHYVASSGTNNNLYVFTPYGLNVGADLPVATFTTKQFDYGDPTGWKRLFWWSAEAKSDSPFSLSVKSDRNAPVSTLHPTPTVNSPGIFKSYLSQRFRTVQYALSASGNFTFYSGTVNVAAKKRVDDRESV